MGTDRDGFLKIRWPLATILWGIFPGAIVFGYNSMRTSADMQSNISRMSASVEGLARGVNNLERRIEVEAQSRYTASDAAKDFALVNARQTDMERRLQRIEGARK